MHSVRMIVRPEDENANQINISLTKHQQRINRRLHWPRRRFLFELGFYGMSLISIILLIVLVYIFVRKNIGSETRCKILLPNRHYRISTTIKPTPKRYPEPGDPLYALCGPCPHIDCPKCKPVECVCTECPVCPAYDISSTCPRYDTTVNDTTQSVTELVTSPMKEIDKTSNLCLTKDCINEASELIQSIDEGANNCDKFHLYACGKLIRQREEKGKICANDIKIQSEVFKKISMEKEKSVVMKIKKFYASCLDEDQIERRGHKPLMEIIKTLGGWPVLDENNKCGETFNIIEPIIIANSIGAANNMLFNIKIATNSSDRNIPLIWLSNAILGMGDPFKYIIKSWGSYYELMIDTALKLGASKQSALKSMNEVLEFESLIAEIIYTEKVADSEWEKIDINKLNSITNSIDWKQVINGFMNISIDSSQIIQVKNLNYFKELDLLISKQEKRVICNYMVWRIVLDLLIRLNKSWKHLYVNAMKISLDQTQKEICEEQVKRYFHSLLPMIRYRKIFPRLKQINIKNIINQVFTSSIRLTDRIAFFDNKTANFGKIKIKSLKEYILDVHRLVESDLLEKMFEKLKMEENQYFENILRIRKFSRESASQIIRTKEISIFEYLSLANDAMDNHTNERVNHLHILLDDIEKIPDKQLSYYNYATIGMAISQRIRWMLFEKPFTSLNSSWWTKKSYDLYQKLINCISDQWKNQTRSEIKKDDVKKYVRETIALNFVQRAFINELDQANEIQLPGFSFNNIHLFYLKLAKVLCENEIVDHQSTFLYPHLDRLDGFFIHSTSFREAFNCTDQSELNKCKIFKPCPTDC